MSKAHIASILVFLALSAGSLVALAAYGLVAFVFTAVAACIAGGVVFNRLATAQERQCDLEDRVRNPPS